MLALTRDERHAAVARQPAEVCGPVRSARLVAGRRSPWGCLGRDERQSERGIVEH
jgi:hypothetical protein